MIVNNSDIKPVKKEINKPAQKVQPQNSAPESPQKEEAAAVPADTLKAYAGIEDKNKKISQEEVVEYLKNMGLKNEQLCEEILKNLGDENGEITQLSFDFLKSFQSKNNPLLLTSQIFGRAKEDGKINYAVLKLVDLIMPQRETGAYYGSDSIGKVMAGIKKPDGSFNKEALKFFIKHADAYTKIFNFEPKYAFAPLKNNKGEFDPKALAFADEKLSSGEEYKNVVTQLFGAKDRDGNFSYKINELRNSLSETFEKTQADYVKEIALSFPEDKKKERDEFIELAKSMKNKPDFYQIFNFIKEIKADEKTKSSLEFDKNTVDFLTEMENSGDYSFEKTKILLKKTELPLNAFSQKDIEVIKDLCQSVDKENVEMFVDASIRKAGKNKGKFDSATLEKYIDIYRKNRYLNPIADIEYMAKCLALEEDDYALDTFAKLYNLRWKTGSRFGSEELLDRQTLHFILMMCCMENNGAPQRPCYEKVLDNLNKLMTMKLPMSSRDAFANFMVYQDIDTVEKLEKIDFMELGLKTGQVSQGIFKYATEEELLHFKEYLKDYLKDKNVESVDIKLNQNISSIVELTTGPAYDRKKLLYDIKKGVPTAEIHERKWDKRVTRKEKDFKNNTVTEYRNKIVYENFADYERLESQILKKFDDDNNLLYEEEIKPSVIPNVFDITRTYPDGKIEKISTAQKTKDGNEIIEKNMTSFDGTTTHYRFEDDPDGNRIFDYVITDKSGKKLLNQSVTFEVIDENHFVSSRNNKKFDIKIQGDNLIVKDLKTQQTKVLELKSFTRDTKELVLPVLKTLPGDELFKMKEIDLKALYANEKMDNAAFSPSEESIMMKPEYLDDAILLHELGHAKDMMMFKEIAQEINKDPKLKEIFNKEKDAYREHFGDAELTKIDYFTADYHYLGANSVHEGIAETNAVLSTCPKNEIQSIRSHYWQQYFPRTIAYLAGLLE